MDSKKYHIPVLLKETIKYLITDINGIYIDATFGLGGHSSAILNKLSKNATLIAFDQDKKSIEKNLIKDKRFYLFHNNFVYIKKFLSNNKLLGKISGILVDLGLSYFQIKDYKRGFSNQIHCTLDMRMNQESCYSAQNVINDLSEDKLIYILREYGDFKNAKKIAKKILQYRNRKKILTSSDLKNIFFISGSFKRRKNFFSRLFQSIRIEVNDEINLLKKFLFQLNEILMLGGRIVILSYHSVEDRLIKNFLKKRLSSMINYNNNYDLFSFKMINKKVIKPTIKEINKNPRSRSAKLRIGEKIL
ncbi:16S rRNA (cytosine(1402)-N(4))-methyltransferase RsmH [Blattabacterium cuenoti]|uniref:16S rRNA (cytosine(1402)-N(4))-methyltransferase RsmH n=1 Tax=Blattabacterium cuenoti TaxID=1653831 RepID=UPI00163C7E9E|nr:16S rRNA (cytosine(1402)-N(4))-methyltransferase RsmH [Blattabacterium cuenoti]